MSYIIKSGVYVDGVEITSEHIGTKLVVLGDDYGDSKVSVVYQPVGFETSIVRVDSNYFYTEDADGDERAVCVDDCYSFATPPKTKQKSSKPQRQKLAKAIREAKNVMDAAIKEAEEVGMMVDITKDSVKITFNPPMEEY